MSVVPIMNDFAREMEIFNKSLFFDDFGLDLFPHDMFHKMRILPWSFFHPQFLSFPFQHFHQIAHLQDEKEKLTIDKDGFQLTFDTKDFKPSELTVKTVNNFVIVEGKHEERKDDQNFTKKHFSRTYLLPSGYNAEEVDSSISSDGVLCVKIPPPHKAIESKERIINIKQTGTNYVGPKPDTKRLY
ncbi:heat shock protein 27-like [Episyrphus balteatus]|uniref:heat shock protein 27-like n=1 Tax=Episyrphus balteatus TaxID=286459 RepID=UPI002485FE19|nr:heat shock protein 27-like [Episyrphus balteatus]